MFTKNKYIKSLIEEAVDRILFEQDETPEEPEQPNETPDELGTDDPGDLDLGGTDTDLGELGGDEGDLDADATGGPEGEDLGGEDAELDGEAPDLGGGFGDGFGGGGSGGGLDFGDEGEPGLGADEEGEEDTITTVGPEDVEIPADPVMAITDDAIQMLSQTNQPGEILNSVKHSIQRYFPEPADATPIIKKLWDTEDITLRDVARRLLLFIKGI